MDAFSHIIQALIVVFMMVGVFVVLYVVVGRMSGVAAKKMPEEEDLEPLHVLDCGGKFDADEYRWPWVKTRYYEDFLVISYREPFKMPYSEIDRIEVQKVGMQEIMIIHHHVPRIPKRIELKGNSVSEAAKLVEDRISGSAEA